MFYSTILFSCNTRKPLFSNSGQQLSAVAPKVLRVTILFANKKKASLKDTFDLAQILAGFGLLVKPAAVSSRKYLSASGFFTITQVCQPTLAVAQFMLLLNSLVSYKSNIIRPIGLCVQSKLFAVSKGIRLLHQLSHAGGIKHRIFIFLNPLLLFLRLLTLLVVGPLRLQYFQRSAPRCAFQSTEFLAVLWDAAFALEFPQLVGEDILAICFGFLGRGAC